MKIIVVGLGNFGSSLALALMDEGHEVIGVDTSLEKVEKLQDRITYCVKLDATELSSLRNLPFDLADQAIIAIGEDVGASITALAQVKKIFNGKIIARSINEIHHAILETIKIDEIVEPEAEFALELAKRIALRKVIKSMSLPGAYEIAEIPMPDFMIGRKLSDIDISRFESLQIITVIKKGVKQNLFKANVNEYKTLGKIGSEYLFEADDILVLFGINKQIEKFANQY